ncbi:hypothetical protein ACFV8Z_44550 [Streptomyces sp. NPDC059837]|uniref:hypothetical protein n=2 Tax=Streptomyces TaxID=1883 RepID=UPI003651D306
MIKAMFPSSRFMALSIAGTSAGSWRESDLTSGLQEGNTILITKPHWSTNYSSMPKVLLPDHRCSQKILLLIDRGSTLKGERMKTRRSLVSAGFAAVATLGIVTVTGIPVSAQPANINDTFTAYSNTDQTPPGYPPAVTTIDINRNGLADEVALSPSNRAALSIPGYPGDPSGVMIRDNRTGATTTLTSMATPGTGGQPQLPSGWSIGRFKDEL